MAKINYDAINFKNKDVDKFSTRFGNGDPVPAPAYTKGRSSNFAGTDRKREPVVPETTSPGAGTVQGPAPIKKENTSETPTQRKTRLQSQMEKYGVEAASSKLSASQQKEYNKNRVKLAKERIKEEARQERNANPTKFDTFVMKTLGRGKYDKGSMRKNMDMGGNRSKLCIDKQGQKAQDAGCKISMAGKFKQSFKKQKPAQNTMWTITK
jgi:hypothetical protein